MLLATAWDGSVSTYDPANLKQTSSTKLNSAVLDATHNENDIYVACLDNSVCALNLQTSFVDVIGVHDNSVKSILYSSLTNQIISGSWDKSVRFFDARAAKQTSPTIINVPQKVFSMDIHENLLIVAMSNRIVNIYDIRNTANPFQERESSLKFMTRSVKFMPNGNGLFLIIPLYFYV